MLVPYAYVSIEHIDCILLSWFTLNATLLTSSVNTLCFLLLYPCCDFNINLLFFVNSSESIWRLSTSMLDDFF